MNSQLQNHFGASTDINSRTCASITAGVTGTCAKTLTEWNNELVERRQSFPGTAFPMSHSYRFTQTGTHYYYNPRNCGVGKYGQVIIVP